MTALYESDVEKFAKELRLVTLSIVQRCAEKWMPLRRLQSIA